MRIVIIAPRSSDAARLADRGLEACRSMDMILAGIGGVFVGLTLAEKTGLPFTPTQALPGVLLPKLLARLGRSLNRQIVWRANRSADGLVREKVLGLPASPSWESGRSRYHARGLRRRCPREQWI